MEAILSRSAPLRPEPTPADCRHSREPFDAGFRCINERRDISPVAKLVHAHLVTLHRTGRAATQTEIGEAIGCSRHQVWRAVAELVAVELVQTIRYGLGRPNGYVLVGIPDEDLDGRATGSRPSRQPLAGSRNTQRDASFNNKKLTKNRREYGSKSYYETSDGDLRMREPTPGRRG